MKLYETITNHKTLQVNHKGFWTKAEGQGILPERTADSMKTFWNNHQCQTLEEYLIESIHEETDFCLNFKMIPSQDFVKRFRQQYSNEFLKMETLQNIEPSFMDNSNLSSYSGLSNRNIGRNVVGFGSGDINHSDGKKSSNLSRQSS